MTGRFCRTLASAAFAGAMAIGFGATGATPASAQSVGIYLGGPGPYYGSPYRAYRGGPYRGYRGAYGYRSGVGPGFIAGAAIGAATAPLWAPGYAPPPRPSRVAPVVRTPGGPYYAYNSVTGRAYQNCVIDEGYGRTRPCDTLR